MMDQASHPKLICPTASKAIPIINPHSGQRQPILVAPKPASAFPASLHPTSRYSDIKLTPNTPINVPHSPVIKLAEDAETKYNEQGLNVYARSYVPEALTIINTLDGQKIDTPAMNQVDFGAYARNYVGWKFLPPTLQPIQLPMNASLSHTDDIIHTHYEQYFRYHLENEIQSQQRENESYSLYEHCVTMEPCQPPNCSFLVPGLRENSPYVEQDDIIQLRQLQYDYVGQGMRGIASLWTGIIYNARVLDLQRKKEQLLVQVNGLTVQNEKLDGEYLLSGKYHMKFNIQFPVQMERYLPMQRVLPIIQKALRQDSDKKNQYQGTYGAINAAYALPSTASSGSSSSLQLNGPPESFHHWLRSMLFPSETNCEVQTKLNPSSFNRPFFDKQLNWEQQKAIESICSYNYGTLPFLISGPPGTGKTKTLVETALQLIKNVENVSHILFCAPSDPAADTLVLRLKAHVTPTELLRLNRPSRTFAEVSDTILSFCCISHDKFSLPPFNELMSYKIIVTTCRDASILMYARMTNSNLYAAEYGLRSSIHPYASQPMKVELHWTALLIDEAAQAMEPEALIPLSVVAPPLESVQLPFHPLFVMAGDEHQLGPRTSLPSSPLKTSLFARLFARPIYARHPLARGNIGEVPPVLNRAMLPIPRPAFANLIRNYRSHPAILAVPSALFYADTLEPEADVTDRLAGWPGWRGRQWPVLFHSNSSEDELEKDGGGWYNLDEAQIACGYAAHLVQTGWIEQSEVCIMSPFKAQVQCLRKTMREPKYGSLWDVDIGPTEAFQGLERGVVILCTTRSKQRFIKKDIELDWGIIGKPNKMNVALTRAKFGLIVIGKRDILLQDQNWKAYLDFCDRNGLVTDKTDYGERLHSRGQVGLTRLEKLLLAREQNLNSSGDSRVLGGLTQDDEMWTSGMRAALNTGSINGYG